MKSNSPVIMIGIDAATWDVIDPLLAENRLPNIARLIKQGTSGKLRSMISYTSPALWTTISTGKIPEKHGVLDFYSATRLQNRCKTVYDILAGNSGRIGLFRWFATWPPPQNAGFTIPSPIARTSETFPRELKFINDLTNPQGFNSYLRGGIQLIRYGARLSTLAKSVNEFLFELIFRPEQREWWYRRRLAEAAIHGDVFAYLLRKYQPSFAAILFTLTDDLSHRYWKYRQPELFDDVTPSDARKFGRVIDDAYMAVDKAVGVILQAAPEDALFVVLSDHGQEAGVSLSLPSHISQKLIGLIGFNDKVWMTNVGFKAYFRSRKADNDNTSLQELKSALEEIRTVDDHRSVIRVEFEEPARLVAEANLKLEDDLETTIRLPGGEKLALKKLLYSFGQISGHHSEWGILVMMGPGIQKDHILEKVGILDVTPTILASRGLPVGRDMDGKVISEFFVEDFLTEYPMNFIDSYDEDQQADDETLLTPEELETLEARLRNLGYLA